MLEFAKFEFMGNIRTIMMPVAIIAGILVPQAEVLSFLLPYLIGTMMVLTFIEKVPKQEHGVTCKIELRALGVSLILVALLFGLHYFFGLPKAVMLGGMIICLCPPANAAPAMAKILGGNPVLVLKILISGHVIACFTIPLIFGYFTGTGENFLEMARRIFNSIQPIITIPLALALGLRSFYPEFAEKIAKFQKYTLVIWGISVFVILSKASYDIREMGFARLWASGEFQMVTGLSAILCALLFFLGWFFERKEHPIEGSQSMGQKNTTLIIWISQMYAGPVAALGPVCYVVWQNLVLSWMSRDKKRK